MLWDMLMMAMVGVIWNKSNNRIFNHKVVSSIDLFDSVLFFLDFCAGHLPLPKKRKVDTSLNTNARKKCMDSPDCLRACESSLSSAIMPVSGRGLGAGLDNSGGTSEEVIV